MILSEWQRNDPAGLYLNFHLVWVFSLGAIELLQADYILWVSERRAMLIFQRMQIEV